MYAPPLRLVPNLWMAPPLLLAPPLWLVPPLDWSRPYGWPRLYFWPRPYGWPRPVAPSWALPLERTHTWAAHGCDGLSSGLEPRASTGVCVGLGWAGDPQVTVESLGPPPPAHAPRLFPPSRLPASCARSWGAASLTPPHPALAPQNFPQRQDIVIPSTKTVLRKQQR